MRACAGATALATPARASARRATRASRTPAPASSRAMAAPMPEDAPTTTALRQGNVTPCAASAEIQSPAHDQPQHPQARARALPSVRRVFRLPATTSVVAHRYLDDAPLHPHPLDHHLGKERRVRGRKPPANLGPDVAPHTTGG